MPRQYSVEMRGRAERLYCRDGHALAGVAALTGVSLKSLRRWKIRYGWAEKKAEAGCALDRMRTRIAQLREKLIENCINTMDAQDVHAVVSVENLVRRAALEDSNEGGCLFAEASGGIDNEESAVAALEKACYLRMNQLSADPGKLDLGTVQALEAGLELVRDLKSKLRRAREYGDGVAGMTALEMSRKILGISD